MVSRSEIPAGPGKGKASRSRHAVERRLETALESSSHALAILDGDGRFETTNTAFRALWSVRRRDLHGLPLSKVLPRSAGVLVREIERALLDGQPLVSGKFTITTVGSGPTPDVPVSRVLDVNVHVIPGDDESTVDGVLVDIVDQTDQRLQEERLRQGQRLEVIGRVAAAIAHDFKNALSAIAGFNELAMSEVPADSVAREDLQQIQFATTRAMALCRQMLVFSRLRSLTPKVVNLNRVLTGFDRLLRRVLGERIQVILHLDPELWPVLAETGQLERVVMNLGINARDAMPNGGRLVFETRNVDLSEDPSYRGDSSGPHVLLTVTDSGAGMDAETRARAFEPFFTTKTGKALQAEDVETEGTGLGLATVFDIVRHAGGTVTLHSEVDRGTTVSIYLPRCDVASLTDVESAPMPIETRLATRIGGRAETLLVVDDDDMVARAAKRVLESNGYSVLVASNSATALELATSTPRLDLALIDLVMPPEDGPRLAEALRRIRPDVRILFMSGYDPATAPERLALLPGMELLEKPFNAVTLLARVGGRLAGK